MKESLQDNVPWETKAGRGKRDNLEKKKKKHPYLKEEIQQQWAEI